MDLFPGSLWGTWLLLCWNALTSLFTPIPAPVTLSLRVCPCLPSPPVGPAYLLAPFLLLSLTLSYVLFFSLSRLQAEKPCNAVLRFLNAQPAQGPGNPISKMHTPLVCEVAPQRRADTTPPRFTSSPSSTYHPWFRAFPGHKGCGMASPRAEFRGLRGLLGGHVVCRACHLTVCLSAFYLYMVMKVSSLACTEVLRGRC